MGERMIKILFFCRSNKFYFIQIVRTEIPVQRNRLLRHPRPAVRRQRQGGAGHSANHYSHQECFEHQESTCHRRYIANHSALVHVR